MLTLVGLCYSGYFIERERENVTYTMNVLHVNVVKWFISTDRIELIRFSLSSEKVDYYKFILEVSIN